MKNVRAHVLCALATAIVLSLFPAPAAAQSRIMSVHSVTADDYERKRTDHGTYERERYALSNGGAFAGTARDQSLDRVPFSEVAGVLAEYLGRQSYFLAKDSASADLLLVVNWGRTIAFDRTSTSVATNELSQAYGALQANPREGPPDAISYAGNPTTPEEEAFESAMVKMLMFNQMRDEINERNARLLGYVGDVNRTDGIQRWAGAGDMYRELIEDLEESRYYVVVTAYDFESMVKEQKPKVRWVTRVSIRAPGQSFADNLPRMMASASRHFGRDTGRLLRGHNAEVEIGEARVVSVSESPADSR